MNLFKKTVQLESDEITFIKWFKNNVDKPEYVNSLIDKSGKSLFGTLDGNNFWFEKKQKFLGKSHFRNLELEFSYIDGEYKFSEEGINISYKVVLKNPIKSLIIIGLIIWLILGLYYYSTSGDTSVLTWFLMFLGMFGLVIWRVYEDGNLVARMIKADIEKDF